MNDGFWLVKRSFLRIGSRCTWNQIVRMKEKQAYLARRNTMTKTRAAEKTPLGNGDGLDEKTRSSNVKQSLFTTWKLFASQNCRPVLYNVPRNILIFTSVLTVIPNSYQWYFRWILLICNACKGHHRRFDRFWHVYKTDRWADEEREECSTFWCTKDTDLVHRRSTLNNSSYSDIGSRLDAEWTSIRRHWPLLFVCNRHRLRTTSNSRDPFRLWEIDHQLRRRRREHRSIDELIELTEETAGSSGIETNLDQFHIVLVFFQSHCIGETSVEIH